MLLLLGLLANIIGCPNSKLVHLLMLGAQRLVLFNKIREDLVLESQLIRLSELVANGILHIRI